MGVPERAAGVVGIFATAQGLMGVAFLPTEVGSGGVGSLQATKRAGKGENRVTPHSHRGLGGIFATDPRFSSVAFMLTEVAVGSCIGPARITRPPTGSIRTRLLAPTVRTYRASVAITNSPRRITNQIRRGQHNRTLAGTARPHPSGAAVPP
jgi:hypothetical protein